MSKEAVLSRIVECGVVAIVRAPSGEKLVDVAQALLAGGVEAVEVTFTVPAAHRVLEQVADRLGDKIVLGAGTVLDPETARAALLAGAQFIVSPTLNRKVIRLCRRYDKAVMPGALTPTEILTAWEAGADIVKVFPSDFTGPGYLKVLHGPLPQVRLLPTGGVTLQTVADFIRAGACAVGVGGNLVEAKAVAAGDMARIESLARQFVDIIKKTRRPAQPA
jgi:2-dehydro-3-deoxyphosphogluconate aldolase/(4S)-4-hydroxy-2-oxoglutarate aldolase